MEVQEVLVEEAYFEHTTPDGRGSRCRMKTGRKSSCGAAGPKRDEDAFDEFEFNYWEERDEGDEWDVWGDWDEEVGALGSPDPDSGEACADDDPFEDGCSSDVDERFDDDISELLEQGRAVSRKALGARGERAAARYLERMGYEILERNWRCPAGEADIIAREGSTLVFIEVKTRTGVSRGFPSEAVDERKRARYEKIAAWYLMDYDKLDVPVRFDVIGLLVVAPDRAFMKHYVNAFSVRG